MHSWEGFIAIRCVGVHDSPVTVIACLTSDCNNNHNLIWWWWCVLGRWLWLWWQISHDCLKVWHIILEAPVLIFYLHCFPLFNQLKAALLKKDSFLKHYKPIKAWGGDTLRMVSWNSSALNCQYSVFAFVVVKKKFIYLFRPTME